MKQSPSDQAGLRNGRLLRQKKTARNNIAEQSLLIIQNIPLVSCPHCGESYFTAGTLRKIERIKLHRQSFAKKWQVTIAEFVSS